MVHVLTTGESFEGQTDTHTQNKQTLKCKKSKEEALESKCLQELMQEHMQMQNIERGRMVITLF